MHGRIELEPITALAGLLALALMPLVVLITFFAADAKIIALFEPIIFNFFLVLLKEVRSNIDLDRVVS